MDLSVLFCSQVLQQRAPTSSSPGNQGLSPEVVKHLVAIGLGRLMFSGSVMFSMFAVGELLLNSLGGDQVICATIYPLKQYLVTISFRFLMGPPYECSLK
jgi:hypothetical protein